MSFCIAQTIHFLLDKSDNRQICLATYSQLSFKQDLLINKELTLIKRKQSLLDSIKASNLRDSIYALKEAFYTLKLNNCLKICDSIKSKSLSDSLKIIISQRGILKERASDIYSKELSKLTKVLQFSKQENAKLADSVASVSKIAIKQFDTLVGGYEFEFKKAKYSFFIVDPKKHDIDFHLNNDSTKQKIKSISKLQSYLALKQIEPIMITNAGMYTPENEPEGLYIEDGKMLYDIDTSTKYTGDNFWLMPNGVFLIDTNNVSKIISTQKFQNQFSSNYKSIKFATQSGPLLLRNDTIHEAFTRGSSNLKIRSGVGIMPNNKVVFVCTTSNANFYDFTLFFKEILGCKNALFLDGAISLMYLKNIGSQKLNGDFGAMISVKNKTLPQK